MALEPGQLATIDSSCRLTVPVEVIRAAGWPVGVPMSVVIELLGLGQGRLFRAEEIRSSVEVLFADAEAAEREGNHDFVAVMADRYRTAALYKEHRIILTKEVLAALEVEPGEKGKLFVQPRGGWIDVLSFRERVSRLGDHERFPPLDVRSILGARE